MFDWTLLLKDREHAFARPRFCFCFTACGFLGPTIAGSGAITKAAREVESFDQVSLAGHADLSIQVGAPERYLRSGMR